MTTSVQAGAEVRAWMARLGIRQKDLAVALGVSQGPMSDRLRGKTSFSIDELATIAGEFDISLGELLGPHILQARQSPRQDLVSTGAGVGRVGLEPTTKGL